MNERVSHLRGYLLAGLFGAAAGGLLVVVVTKAIPKMMSRMMQNMMTQIGVGDCVPDI